MTRENKRQLGMLLIGLTLMTIGTPVLAQSTGLDTLTDQDVTLKIANIVKILGFWTGLSVFSLGSIMGSWKFFNGAEGAMKFIGGCAAGSAVAFSSWALAKLWIGKVGG